MGWFYFIGGAILIALSLFLFLWRRKGSEAEKTKTIAEVSAQVAFMMSTKKVQQWHAVLLCVKEGKIKTEEMEKISLSPAEWLDIFFSADEEIIREIATRKAREALEKKGRNDIKGKKRDIAA